MKDARGEYNISYRFIHAWDGDNAGWRTVEIRQYDGGDVKMSLGCPHYNSESTANEAAMQRVYQLAADALWDIA